MLLLAPACGGSGDATPTPVESIVSMDNFRRTQAIDSSGYDMAMYDFYVDCSEVHPDGCYRGVYFTVIYSMDGEEYTEYGTTGMEYFSEKKVYSGVVRFLLPERAVIQNAVITVNEKEY